ncbi:MAG: cobalt-zinc-cadmium efflux system membrane fusion protein [Planctomycetota bacterium]|jgi:cobalt-zinc-cadmium efflux system membrane fusion protein
MNRQFLCIMIMTLLVLCACRDDSGPRGHKSPPSARIEGGRSEADAALVILPPESVERLGIQVAVVGETDSPTLRLLGADVMLPTDARMIVRAPFVGRVLTDKATKWPTVGQTVSAQDGLMFLQPVLTPEREVLTPNEQLDLATKRLDVRLRKNQAEGELESATARLIAAKAEYERASELLKNKLGDVKRVEAALAAMNVAKAQQMAAERASIMLETVMATTTGGKGQPMSIKAPIAGLIENMTVGPGQLVAAGADLITLISMKEMWLAVDIYAGEISELDLDAVIEVFNLGAKGGEVLWRGVPLNFMLDNRIGQATTRRYYRLEKNVSQPSPKKMPLPGERVAVRIPRFQKGMTTTLPMAAVIFDLNGAAWVYCEESKGRYRRAPILIQSRDGDQVRLMKGPKPGVRVVIEGAAELFGTEFGTGK